MGVAAVPVFLPLSIVFRRVVAASPHFSSRLHGRSHCYISALFFSFCFFLRPLLPPTLSSLHRCVFFLAVAKGSGKGSSRFGLLTHCLICARRSWSASSVHLKLKKKKSSKGQSEESWLSQLHLPGGWLFLNGHIHRLLHVRWTDAWNLVLHQTWEDQILQLGFFKRDLATFYRPYWFNWWEAMGIHFSPIFFIFLFFVFIL